MWKNSNDRYGSLQVALHWLALALLVAVYLTIELREIFPKGSDPRTLMKSLHFMLGLSVLLLVMVRIAARFSGPTPPNRAAACGVAGEGQYAHAHSAVARQGRLRRGFSAHGDTAWLGDDPDPGMLTGQMPNVADRS